MATRDTITQRIALEGGREVIVQLTAVSKAGDDAVSGVKKAADAAAKSGDAAARSFASAKIQLDGVGKSAASLTSTFVRLGGLLGAALGARALINITSSWDELSDRIGNAIGENENASVVLNKLADIARRSSSSIDVVSESFLRNKQVLDEARVSTEGQIQLQEALSLALKLSGTSGEKAAAVQDQLTKAFSEGQLGARGLTQIMLQGGRVAQALADELGVNVNQLSALAKQGKITDQVIFKALVGSLGTLRKEAGASSISIRDAFSQITTEFTRFIGNADQASGAGATIARALLLIADNMNIVIPLIAAFGAAWALTKLGSVISGLFNIVSGLIVMARQLAVLGPALLANPFTLWAIAITTTVVALLALTGKLDDVLGAVKSVGTALLGTQAATDSAGRAMDGYATKTTQVTQSVVGNFTKANQSIAAGSEAAASSSAKSWGEGSDEAGDAVNEFRRRAINDLKDTEKQAKSSGQAVSKFFGSLGRPGTIIRGGEVSSFSGGGKARGPGSGTSDSILARISNGEYIIRAAAVRKFGTGIFNMLNSLRMPSFAAGGLVAAGLPAQVTSSGVSGRPLSLTLGGETFEGLIAPENVADRLVRFATSKALRQTGRKPGWYGR